MNFKLWMVNNGLSYNKLALIMGLSCSTLWKKVNGDIDWKPRDLAFLHREFGLSADFVLGFEEGTHEKPLQLV